MEEVKVIDLKDGTYIISDEISINGIRYVFLTNEKDMLDFCIRKVVINNNEEYIDYLDTDEEFDAAMQAFLDKHKQELEDFN